MTQVSYRFLVTTCYRMTWNSTASEIHYMQNARRLSQLHVVDLRAICSKRCQSSQPLPTRHSQEGSTSLMTCRIYYLP